MNKIPTLWVVLFLVVIGALVVPITARAASLEISEIMYSPKGADAAFEWVEVHNVGGQSVTLTEWNLRENKTDHRISTSSGQTTLPAGAYAVLAGEPAQFTSRYSGYTGPLFDSTFGLNNGGETLTLIDSSDTKRSVTYSPTDSADGTGKSLQKTAGGWAAGSPTPGQENTQSKQQSTASTKSTKESPNSGEETNTDSDTDTGGNESTDSSRNQGAGWTPHPEAEANKSASDAAETKAVSSHRSVSIDPGGDVQAIAGVLAHLDGSVQSPDTSDVDASDVIWSLGNGDTKHGADVFYTYDHPGTYVATMMLPTAEDIKPRQITVNVAAPDITITSVRSGPEGFVKIANNLNRDVNLSGWHLRANGDTFTLPAYTIAIGGKSLTIANKASGLETTGGIGLLYPNGEIADTYTHSADAATTNATSSSAGDNADRSNQAAENSGSSRVAGAHHTTDEPSHAHENTRSKTVDTTAGSQPESKPSSTQLSTLFSSSTQQAAVGKTRSNFWGWAGLLALVVAAGAGSIVVLQQYSVGKNDPDRLADTFDIEEL